MSSWQLQVDRAARKLSYRLQRKEQTAMFWSVGVYGWVWTRVLCNRPALELLHEEAVNIEQRMFRIERRYLRLRDTLPA